MAYADFKDLNRRTFADKVLRYKSFDTGNNPKYDGYQCFIGFINFLIKKLLVVVLKMKIFLIKRLAEELH